MAIAASSVGGRAALKRRIEGVLGEAIDAVGFERPEQLAELDLENALALTELALELVVERLETDQPPDAAQVASLGRLVGLLTGVLRELHAHGRGERLDALTCVHDGLVRLRGSGSLAQLLADAAAEACRSCGVDRALLLRIEAGRLRVESVHVEGDVAESERLRAAIAAAPSDLSPGSLETEVVRRRVAVLIAEPASDARASGPLADLRGRQPVVAAPVLCEGQVVVLLEADCAATGRRLERLHRDALVAFAHGLGHEVERAALLERLRLQRDRVRGLAQAAEAVADELGDAQTGLIHARQGAAALGPMTAALLTPADGGVDQLLSAREIEVVQAMASGATNAEIATRLFISEATVKTHVKQILRKLGAANRVQAVSRYFELTVRRG